ncbi:RNA polymerase sigma factor [Glaciihabitans tibetensis]|uniref:RNA polymerase sigma factor n=1 Tax=Glaciihabitans tibetensis TaxID=1266600 RepID=UPI001FEBD050|nr:sigma-70 family RNA polymerase sigma factor [Glaciihabitans tibetensis]
MVDVRPAGPLDDAPDGILAARAADGDVAAFEALVYRHGALMRVYAAKVLGSEAEADDVVQDVFIQAWGQFDRLHDPRAVRSWLMRMVSNRSIERIRKRKDHVSVDDWDAPTKATESPEHVVEVRMQLGALSAVVDRLPEMQRQCWALKEIGGVPYADIAEQLDIPISTVRGQLARARRTIIQEMEAWR